MGGSDGAPEETGPAFETGAGGMTAADAGPTDTGGGPRRRAPFARVPIDDEVYGGRGNRAGHDLPV